MKKKFHQNFKILYLGLQDFYIPGSRFAKSELSLGSKPTIVKFDTSQSSYIILSIHNNTLIIIILCIIYCVLCIFLFNYNVIY